MEIKNKDLTDIRNDILYPILYTLLLIAFYLMANTGYGKLYYIVSASFFIPIVVGIIILFLYIIEKGNKKIQRLYFYRKKALLVSFVLLVVGVLNNLFNIVYTGFNQF